QYSTLMEQHSSKKTIPMTMSSTPHIKASPALCVVILAAGKGTRMVSKTAKVLHPLAGRPMIKHIIKTAEALLPQKIIVVLAPDMDDVAACVAPHHVAIQTTQKGTGDALRAAIEVLGDFKGQVLVLSGDVPLVTATTLQSLIDHHRAGHDFGATVMAMAVPDPTGYGRIFQHANGTLKGIVEEKDATADERLVRLCYSGLMVVEGDGLLARLNRIQNPNAQGEYYLVDLPRIFAEDDIETGVVRGNFYELRGVNTRAQLAELEMAWQHRKRLEMMHTGVTLLDPNTVYFAADTVVAPDTVIGASVVFGEKVTIESDVEIRAFCHIEGAHIQSGAVIGPFARIRPTSVIKQDAKIGNFVEVKNSTIGVGAKANHLGYIGDAELGDHSNFGCGAITVNYDGKVKSKTTIGKYVMVGSNASLIAPLTVEDGAYIAAGSTITQNIPEDTLAVSRAKQVNMIGRAKGRFKKD
ncbi:MAG: bifunctional UDP-N-acetylglucosamine diphosphorylase/glucosamine-1-phosphate N-acetyltransferase GlmU, partial [Pseudomonadota bacterium]